MPIPVWIRTANPAIDPPSFNTPPETAHFWVSCGRARYVENRRGKPSKHRIQLTVEHRLDHAPVVTSFPNFAVIEGGTVWRVVHQSKPGCAPGNPGWQLVP